MTSPCGGWKRGAEFNSGGRRGSGRKDEAEGRCKTEAEVVVDHKHSREWVMSPQGVMHETWDDQPPWVSPHRERAEDGVWKRSDRALSNQYRRTR